ncbi:uncharacterized protein LOC114530660 isoform X2 [Dendronephthya gigantea]|nr:uncharacterized protein LOC114530660 isoform X2 [Dendronephthya gigantea]
MSKIEERRCFINSKNRLTMGIYNQGKQSHTIYRESGLSGVFEKMSKKSKDKTKEDMSKVLDCSSFQIEPLQACITETTFDDFNLPNSESSDYSQKEPICYVDLEGKRKSSSAGSAHNFTINKCNMVDDVPERIELASEPQLEDITSRLMNSIEPSETFGKDHLQDIRSELKEYYRKRTLQQDYCDGHILLNTVNNPSTTPVQIGKTLNAGKRLFPSSINRIGCMSRDLEKSTVNFLHENPDLDSKKISTQENAVAYDNMDGQCTTKEHYDASHGDPELTHDILSIIDEEYIDNSAVDLTKYASISPLKKPSMNTPSPCKLLPRKLF